MYIFIDTQTNLIVKVFTSTLSPSNREGEDVWLRDFIQIAENNPNTQIEFEKTVHSKKFSKELTFKLEQSRGRSKLLQTKVEWVKAKLEGLEQWFKELQVVHEKKRRDHEGVLWLKVKGLLWIKVKGLLWLKVDCDNFGGDSRSR